MSLLQGGGTGIGRAACCLLVQEGATAAITHLNEQVGKELFKSEWDHVMKLNVKGIFFCTKHVVPFMKQSSGGSSSNISSLHRLIGTPDYLASDELKFVTASELVIDSGATGERLME